MFRFVSGLLGGIVLSTAHSFLIVALPNDAQTISTEGYNEIKGIEMHY
jgi:hypothetical protein